MGDQDAWERSPKFTGHLTGAAREFAETRFARRPDARRDKEDVLDHLLFAWSNEGARPAGLIRSAIEDIERLRAECDHLRAFAATVADLVDEHHYPWPGFIEADGEVRSVLLCHGCCAAGRNVPWPCSTHLVVHPEPVMPTDAELIGISHMAHARSRNCLDAADRCCDARRNCHEEWVDG